MAHEMRPGRRSSERRINFLPVRAILIKLSLACPIEDHLKWAPLRMYDNLVRLMGFLPL